LHGASHEILLILKSDSIREKEKKKEAEDLFSTKLTEERFALLTNLAKKITDFNPDDEDEKRDIVSILFFINFFNGDPNFCEFFFYSLVACSTPNFHKNNCEN